MKLNDYQQAAAKFAKYGKGDYPFAALSEESGEVMGKLAKYGRKNDCSILDAVTSAKTMKTSDLHDAVKKELGDVLWQLSACCGEIGITLEELAEDNLAKLCDRDDRGVIVGEGDNR